MQNNELSLTSMRQRVLKISHFKVRKLSKIPFCRFLASFSFKYDVRDAILLDSEKMKVHYFRSLSFDLFETLQAVRSKHKNVT